MENSVFAMLCEMPVNIWACIWVGNFYIFWERPSEEKQSEGGLHLNGLQGPELVKWLKEYGLERAEVFYQAPKNSQCIRTEQKEPHSKSGWSLESPGNFKTVLSAGECDYIIYILKNL